MEIQERPSRKFSKLRLGPRPCSFNVSVAPDALPCERVPQKIRPLALGANIQQCMWTPTIRRVPLVSLIGKPSFKGMPPVLGPKVPDSHIKADPAYSFGQRHHQKIISIGEGPATVNTTGLCYRGPYCRRAVTLKGRFHEVTSRTIIPGVGTYDVQRGFNAANKKACSYTFGRKPQPKKPFLTPAPNVYVLPPVVGTAKEGDKKAAPAYSLASRHKDLSTKFALPGPGHYNHSNIRFKRSPKYTMRPLWKILDNKLYIPGPAAYCPEKTVTHRSVPAPSFSIRYSPHLGYPKIYLIKDCQQAATGDCLTQAVPPENNEKSQCVKDLS